MSALEIFGLLVAGIAAGLTGSVAGLASLCSYPALLAVGLPPVTANVTNTVALVFSSAGSVWGFRPELAGQSAQMRRLVPAGAAGGLAGGVLLLVTPSGDFKRIVPWLIFGASVSLLRRRRTVGIEHRGHREGWGLFAATFVIGVYGGYFGAAAGVVLLALLLFATAESVPRASAAKNLILGAANATAAVLFALASSVRWSAVVPLAVGLFVGGRIGPVVVRRTPPRALLVVIAFAGVGLAVYLGVDAYG